MSQEKKYEISAASAILCILVVFIHVSSMPITSLQKDSLAYLSVFIPWRLSAFVVQGFIFLSALKIFLNSQKIDYKKYYLSRFKKVVVPYVLWVLIYYIYFCSENYFSFNLKRLVKEVLAGTLVSPFYFIIAIIQFYALAPLWIKIYKNCRPALAIAVSALITILFGQHMPQILNALTGFSFKYNDRFFTTYILYWTLGALAGLNYDRFTFFIKNNFIYVFIVFAALAAADIYFAYGVFVFSKSAPFLETLHVLYCVSAVMFLISICHKLKGLKILKMIGNVSYAIFLSHCLVIFATNKFLYEHGIYGIKNRYIISFSTVYIITFSCCLLYGYLKTKYNKNWRKENGKHT